MKIQSCKAPILALAVLLASALPVAVAAPSGADPIRGNGFPKGPHYNLNLLGKATNFTCPAGKVDDETGEPAYGNVIFMPRVIPEGGVTIAMVEGGVADDDADNDDGAGSELKLGVLDWCTQPFLDAGETTTDGALVTLPPSPNGYSVYARLTGKPGAPSANSKGKKKGANKGKKKGKGVQAASTDPTLAIDGDLVVLTDAGSGEALALLGTVDESGVFTPSGGFDTGSTVLVRTDPNAPGKGVVKATDISALFQFSGSICQLGATADSPFCAPVTGQPACQAHCCVSNSPDGGTTPPDTIIDSCSALVDDGDPATPLACPVSDATAAYTPAQCKHYEDAWVFDIQSLAQYLWTLSGGSYNVQVRFYPR